MLGSISYFRRQIFQKMSSFDFTLLDVPARENSEHGVGRSSHVQQGAHELTGGLSVCGASVVAFVVVDCQPGISSAMKNKLFKRLQIPKNRDLYVQKGFFTTLQTIMHDSQSSKICSHCQTLIWSLNQDDTSAESHLCYMGSIPIGSPWTKMN